MNVALIALHGVGGNRGYWNYCFAELTRLSPQIDAIALDLPGYGENLPCPKPLSFEGQSSWLAKEIVSRIGEKPFVLLGQSYGGMLALDFVCRDASGAPAPVGLVLMNTSPAFGKPDGPWQQEFVNSRLAPLRAGKSMADVGRGLIPTMLGSAALDSSFDKALAMMSAVRPETYEQAVQCLLGFDRRFSLPGIKLPVHCIAGGEDKTAPASVMQIMSTKFAQGSCEVIAGSGHLSALELPFTCAFLINRFVHSNGWLA